LSLALDFAACGKFRSQVSEIRRHSGPGRAMEIKSNLAWQLLFVASALVFGALAAFAEPQQVSPLVITQVEVSRPDEKTGQKTVVRVTGSGPLVCQTMLLSDPERLVLNFPGARLAKPDSSISSSFPPVLGVQTDQFNPDVAHVVIGLEQAVAYRVRTEENGVAVEFDVAASAPARSAPATAAPPGQAVLSSEKQAAPLEDGFKDGMLTFRAKGQSLRSVLKQIGDQAGVSMYLPEGFGNDQISVEFQHYRLVDALRQILGDDDVFFLYGERQGTQGSPALRAVWVYPVGRTETPLPLLETAVATPQEAAPAQTATGATAAPRVEAPTAPVQAETSANAASRDDAPAAPKGDDSAAEVLRALQDHNDEVREQALSEALAAKVQIPQDTLINLALTDPSEKVRVQALKALPVDPDLRWVAERAAGDLDEDVTYAARGILRMLDLRERAKAWAERTANPPEH